MSAPGRPRRTRLLPRFCVCGAGLLATIWVILLNGITGRGTAFTIKSIIPTRYKKNEPPETLTFINWTKIVPYAHILGKTLRQTQNDVCLLLSFNLFTGSSRVAGDPDFSLFKREISKEKEDNQTGSTSRSGDLILLQCARHIYIHIPIFILALNLKSPL